MPLLIKCICINKKWQAVKSNKKSTGYELAADYATIGEKVKIILFILKLEVMEEIHPQGVAGYCYTKEQEERVDGAGA
jgi:hypothetical protein